MLKKPGQGTVKRTMDVRPNARRRLTKCKSAAGSSSSRPHKPTLPLTGLDEGDARAEHRPTAACRLHLRVRPRPACSWRAQRLRYPRLPVDEERCTQ
jgi:hypothetical protein